jgi:transposase
MQKFKPVNNTQYFLLPPSVEDFIKEDHLARVVSEVVDELDTSAIENRYSYLGQKSYHPKLLLKLLFYGYAIGIRSGRKIAAACESDVAFMYLSCMYKPDFRTINDFRKDNIEFVEQLFIEVIKLCTKMKMVTIGTLVIDSTKLRANASHRRTKTKEQYEQWLSNIEKQVKEIMTQADVTDKEEDEKYGDNRGDEIPKEIDTKEKLRRKIKEAIKQMKEEDDKINLTDNDAKVVRSGGSLRTSYNCQTSSTANGIIVSAYVTNAASDREHLLPVIQQAENNTQQKSETILADSGYASYDNYEQLTQLNKTILIPDQEKETENRKASDNPYHRNHFTYDKNSDKFTCPQNKELIFYTNCNNTANKQIVRIYQGIECSSCKSKPLCTKGKARQIHVEKREPIRAVIRQLLDSEEGRQFYKLRQQIIEPIFGNIKHNLQYTMLHLRSLRKVNTEWQLICLTHNIKQIWKAKLQGK